MCGALNGAAHAIFFVTGAMDKKQREASYAIIQDFFLWYEQTALPDYRPKNPKYEIVKSVSGSNLCHVSVRNGARLQSSNHFPKSGPSAALGSPLRSQNTRWRFSTPMPTAHSRRPIHFQPHAVVPELP